MQKFTDVCMVGGNFVTPPPLPPYRCLYNFLILRSYIFVSFQQITFKLANSITKQLMNEAEYLMKNYGDLGGCYRGG